MQADIQRAVQTRAFLFSDKSLVSGAEGSWWSQRENGGWLTCWGPNNLWMYSILYLLLRLVNLHSMVAVLAVIDKTSH